jgi:hypothetical protein
MTVYRIEHPTIKFSSTSKTQIDFYEKILKDVSLDDIKENRVAARHTLLVNMACAGECYLIDELIQAVKMRYGLVKDHMQKFKKKSDYMSIKERVTKMYNNEVYLKTGWRL